MGADQNLGPRGPRTGRAPLRGVPTPVCAAASSLAGRSGAVYGSSPASRPCSVCFSCAASHASAHTGLGARTPGRRPRAAHSRALVEISACCEISSARTPRASELTTRGRSKMCRPNYVPLASIGAYRSSSSTV
eukprot:scaffold113478_cov60-Phaeocystis_antarctica.AAC.1